MEYSCNRSYHWIIIPPDRLFHHILNYFQITMKRISFNDKYGLTKAVLEGRKTQERRIITCPSFYKDEKWNLNYFERYVENDYYPFKMNDETFYRQCIPYVGNEDLCYTTLEPKTLRLSKKITHYRPKRHETYFTIYFCDYITGFGVIADEWWDNPGTDEIRLKAGHVFRTEAEAQSFCEKINKLLKERRP